MNEQGKERIAKALSRLGVASRRDAEAMISEGRIAVNGLRVEHPATFVTDADAISVDGEIIGEKDVPRLWLYHKPIEVMVAARDPQGRKTIYDCLPADMPRVMPIGRLDYKTEGLLLLTNSGGLKRHLELPATGWLRQYRVRVFGDWDKKIPDQLKKGITVDGIRFGPIDCAYDNSTKTSGKNFWVNVTLREGKNREVRRAMQHMGLTVNRLIRTSYGPFNLSTMPPDAVQEVSAKVLREQIGKILETL